MATDIPKARRILLDTLTCYDMNVGVREAIKLALSLMTRAQSPKRFNPHRRPMTPELAEAAREMYETTGMTQAQIGEYLDIDSGRVSEAINGLI